MNDNKKIKYVKIKDEDYENVPAKPKTPNKKKPAPGHLTTGEKVKKSLAVIGTTLLSMFLIIIITGCIVATALTVYIMQFAEDSFDVDLTDVDLSYTTFIKAYDKDGNEQVIKELSTDENRIWVDIDDIPQCVIDAVVATEDKRFFEHDGVDWTRTFGVTLKAVFENGTDGGSTITQQLVRDITKDTKVNIGRKLREIFRAMSLEQKYTKMDILESYLNRIAFGGTTYGIGTAAQYYFGKDINEIDVAEAAILAGIIRSPSNYNPYASLKQAKTRQLYVLKDCMYEQGLITTAQYEAAAAEQVKFRLPVLGEDFGYSDEERYNEYYGIQGDGDTENNSEDDLYYENEDYDGTAYNWDGNYEVTQNWYVDAGINQVVSDIAQDKGITETEARKFLYSSGYSIYLNMDIDIQNKVEEVFRNPSNFLSYYDKNAANEDLLQAAMVIMDYSGNVIAVAGGIGEKPGDSCFNRATQSVTAVGSTIKPIATYSLALENNVIDYSTMLLDLSGIIKDNGEEVRWPHNYQETGYGSGTYVPAWYGVEKSMNTIAVRVLSMVGLQNSLDQMVNKLGFSTLGNTDLVYSALGTGSVGVKLYELAAAYQIFGNGGVYYEPYFYSKVVDNDGNIVYEQNTVGTQAISKDTAWITNRMMYTVTHDMAGSGPNALLDNVEVVGKTGTANDMSALLFCGLTPEYVASFRLAYDDSREIGKGDGWIAIAKCWHNVMASFVDTTQTQTFSKDNSTKELTYCTDTGLIAGPKCKNTAIGYYRQSNIPETCDGDHEEYWRIHADYDPPKYY